MKWGCNNMLRWLTAIALSGSMAACTDNPTADLETYVKETKDQQRSSIEPLPEFEPFESYIYQANELRDPFTEPTFAHAPTSVAQAGGSGIKPDFDRAREPLEEYPLDSLRMVGTLEQDQDSWALILDTEETIHRVQHGHYMGQNYGKIVRVSEFEVELMEIIPDGLGGWMERQASIAISE
ncbi:MAG: pilus assembly protein PilP [Gammaproteobacteria bacterium]|nr:pilus assembly protein PilP [Gammaproteobacteria bacterium]MDH3560989.1 pilus assembly protein PilP [Gammaproteobacteria bacterium]